MIVPISVLILSSVVLTDDGPIAPPKPPDAQIIEKSPADKPVIEKTEKPYENLLPPVVRQEQPDKFEVPKIEIVGTEEPYQIGDLILLSIKPLEKLPEELKSAVFSWTVLPEPSKLITWPNKTQIIFGTGNTNTEYTIILNSTFSFVKDSVTEYRATTTIVKCVVGIGPVKSVAAPTGLIKVQDFSKKITANLSSVLLDEAVKKADVKKLAASFRKLAGVIEDQKNLSKETIITMQSSDCQEALGANSNAFIPWFDLLTKELKALNGSRELTRSDFVQTYRAVATALESY